ncbi:MAG: hypothetical protein H7343_03555, partial [Undibacterium sp.]|nr:hypothetical protein [Opitutaceae bacterium]
TAKERTWLGAYLAAKDRTCDPLWQAEMARRLKRMRAGHGVTETQYRRLSRQPSQRAPAAAK